MNIKNSFNELRNSLIEEAARSPLLLSDLAGLENYISETYTYRSFIELVQNADDAQSTMFCISKFNDDTIIASNNGRIFSQEDVVSICRSASSSKDGIKTIGYRGIGFKSVVGFCTQVHIVSGDYAITFSKELTKNLLDNVECVPLIRIPHVMNADVYKKYENVIHKHGEMNTFFIFEGIKSDIVENELINFDPSSLMFLNNLQHFEINHFAFDRMINIQKTLKNDSCYIKILDDCIDGKKISQYIAFDVGGAKITPLVDKYNKILPLNEKSLIYSFIPTDENTGINAKINCNFNTDPSRTKLVFNDDTIQKINNLADSVIQKILFFLRTYHINSSDAILFISAISPENDPRIKTFRQATFKSIFFDAIQQKSLGKFDDYILCPKWINLADFQEMCKALHFKPIPQEIMDIKGYEFLFRSLNCTTFTLGNAISSLTKTSVSMIGSAKIISEIIKQHSYGIFDISKYNQNAKLWFVDSQAQTIQYILEKTLPLDRDFVCLIVEELDSEKQLQLFCEKFSSKENIKILLDNALKESMHKVPTNIQVIPRQDTDITKFISEGVQSIEVKWRTAEEFISKIFTQMGFRVEDVTKQNIGYDYHCVLHDEEVFVEVKNINNENDGFTLTTNEEIVAREKSSRYIIALVRNAHSCIEVCLLKDPLRSGMKIARQCRQWAWFCSDYPYDPIKYKKSLP